MKLSCRSEPRYSLARVGSFHVVGVDVDVWEQLVEDAARRVHQPVGHLRRNSHRVPEFSSGQGVTKREKKNKLQAAFKGAIHFLVSWRFEEDVERFQGDFECTAT